MKKIIYNIIITCAFLIISIVAFTPSSAEAIESELTHEGDNGYPVRIQCREGGELTGYGNVCHPGGSGCVVNQC